MDVIETSIRHGENFERSFRMPVHFRALAGQTASCPTRDVFLHSWPYVTLFHQSSRTADTGMGQTVQCGEDCGVKVAARRDESCFVRCRTTGLCRYLPA
ncbi:hypothetical protein T09_7690 [Trichinella sp. T9]|nr:hypothetical protein T09_7690 [Trichinella sp. T9]